MRCVVKNLALGSVLLAVACGGGGGGSSPTAPSATTTTTTPSVTFTGTVTNIVTGVVVAGATITIGTVSATSATDGTYSLAVMAAGTPSFSASAQGYYTRESAVSMSGSTTINSEIIPQGDGFNLEFFDWVFRENGTEGTRRPTVMPNYQIWTRQMQCTKLTDDGYYACERMEVIADSIPAIYEQHIRSGIAQFSRLTGGAFTNPTITTKTHPVGLVIPRNDWLTANGTVSLSYFPAGLWSDANSDGNNAYMSMGLSSTQPGHILHGWRAAEDLGIVTHELAHSLGYGHPSGREKWPDSIMGDYQDGGYGISAADELHGRILYKRPNGSLTPDRDPAGTTIN